MGSGGKGIILWRFHLFLFLFVKTRCLTASYIKHNQISALPPSLAPKHRYTFPQADKRITPFVGIMNGAQVSKCPPLLIAVPRSKVLPAPLDGASKTFQQTDGGESQSNQHQRSSLPMPAPSPPPQTIDSGNSSGRSYGGAKSNRDTAPTIGYRRKSSESAPLIGIGPESPTVISSPTGLLTISTGLSPTKGPRGGSLASAASDSPGPAGYPSSSYGQPPILAPAHAAARSSAGAFAPQGNIFGVYPNSQPLYMTRPAAAAVDTADYVRSSFTSASSAAAALPLGHIKTEDNQKSGGGCGEPVSQGASSGGGGASFGSLDSSSFFAITSQSPYLSADLADLTHPELETILLRQSPPTICDGSLVGDGGGFDDLPAVVGGLGGGIAGGCSETSDDSGGGRGHGGGVAGGAGVPPSDQLKTGTDISACGVSAVFYAPLLRGRWLRANHVGSSTCVRKYMYLNDDRAKKHVGTLCPTRGRGYTAVL